jgi:hypothetical protein
LEAKELQDKITKLKQLQRKAKMKPIMRKIIDSMKALRICTKNSI